MTPAVIRMPERPRTPGQPGRPRKGAGPVILPIAPPGEPRTIEVLVPPRAMCLIIEVGDFAQVPAEENTRDLGGGLRASFWFRRIVRPDGLPDVEGPTLAR